MKELNESPRKLYKIIDVEERNKKIQDLYDINNQSIMHS